MLEKPPHNGLYVRGRLEFPQRFEPPIDRLANDVGKGDTALLQLARLAQPLLVQPYVDESRAHTVKILCLYTEGKRWSIRFSLSWPKILRKERLNGRWRPGDGERSFLAGQRQKKVRNRCPFLTSRMDPTTVIHGRKTAREGVAKAQLAIHFGDRFIAAA